ncbi:DNA topoisomerase IV subunit A [Oceanicella actignis]|uniref:DNA topoisomerase 4 subunit A n=1 Tax=Oceanicella actignis TaxID=1189325 RepID=A0A1M7TXD8_9RHOB|nr:DNA topoisomerase IV subunit A [Oceanicella actignis]SET80244.1 DNA topoisomerase IV subunit A [Oceanicella actignis]SHN75391.1 topoisomerase-4 subunit A [Oceanicella actignis]
MADSIDTDDIGPGPGAGGAIIAEPLRRALGDRYLQYALSTIMHRALPDARDGLKPVHRRLLWAMRLLKLDPAQGFKKSARVVGDVIGKYHPHGDQAVYDALVRLAQDFAVRYPLIDGQGNFGNIDGDNAAAMRYTESRLTAVAAELLDGLDEDAVDFRPTYDGEDEEPEVLPGAFPNLLANGASGIAVGMATSIPPHNAAEVIDAALHLIAHPDASVEDLLRHVPGPDFPTGGVLVEPRESIVEAYRTGRGGFRLRASWRVEDLGRGQWRVVVDEIPYQVQKSRLIEKIAELINARKIPILADVRDESAEDVRLVLEPRSRNVDPAVLMETLFRLTDLEVRVPLNMNVLIDGRTPRVCSLSEVLRAFLDHQREVLVRRSRHRLERIARRLEVLAGYIIAYLDLDRVIEIIRTEDDPKAALMAEDWSAAAGAEAAALDFARRPGGLHLTETQAEAILNMRLRALRKLEEMELRAERDALSAERAELEALLASEEAQWARVAGKLREVRARFGAPEELRAVTFAEDLAALKARHGAEWPQGARRTGFADAPKVEEVPLEAMIEREPITVVCSRNGWIRAMKGHNPLDAEVKFKDGDGPRFAFHAETTDRILLFATNGRFYTISAANLPGGRGMGEPVRLMVDLPNDEDLVAIFPHRPGMARLLASSAGDGFVVDEAELLAQTRAGKQALNLREGVRAAVCRPAVGDHVAVVGENRKLLVFALDELPRMSRGKGVRLQKYKDGGLSDAMVFAIDQGLRWFDGGGRVRTVARPELDEWMGKRGGAGRMAPRGFPRDNRFPPEGAEPPAKG